MKIQIRQGVFETNSSSTHSITMMMKSDYDKWKNEYLYLYKGSGFGWSLDKPEYNHLYTKDEVFAFAKSYKYYNEDDGEIDDEMLAEMYFICWDNRYKWDLESFYKEFTTPSGETVVAFGEYGYDG